MESAGSDLNAPAGENESSRRNMFVQELLLATLTEQLSLATEGSADDPSSILEALRSPESEEEKGSMSIQKKDRNTSELHIKNQGTSKADKAVGGAVERSAGGQGARPVSAGAPREGSWGHVGTAASASSPHQIRSPITVPNSVAIHGPNLGSVGGMSVMQGRASAPHGGRERGLNPASAKRSMLKHMPPQRGASDTDPPPY